jgi:hypothetical protein
MSEDDRRVLAAWAADCAERVLPLFEDSSPDDPRPRAAIDGARAWARGDIPADRAQALALDAHEAARAVEDRAARSAARAAGQACAVAQMGGQARHAAAYAVAAVMQADPDDPESTAAELEWQRGRLSGPNRALAYPEDDRPDPGPAPTARPAP